MKTEKNILIAFILNLSFSIFEFIGGIFTGSVAIISDSVHDIGDAASIGIAFFLERKSKKQPDEKYTYGYKRYSLLGGIITTLILLLGSIAVVYNAVSRIISPTEINYNGMIIFAIVGVCVNLCASLLTRDGDSINQKAVNLHMLEDVLGWVVVLIGAIVMRFTDFYIIDPLMSIGEPSDRLADRVLGGVELYKKGVAPKIIMSGDHGREDYDEVGAMKRYAIENGVPSSDIFMDHEGFSTYESMYRAKEMFGAEKIVIVTQEYHLYRAIYIAEGLGIEAYGVSTDYHTYAGQTKRDIREVLARCKDLVMVLFKPEASQIKEKISLDGDGDITNEWILK